MSKYMHFDNVTLPEEKRKMQAIEKDGVCPFCPEHFDKYHDSPILKEGRHWWLAKNDYPYEGSELHLLFVHKTHIEDLKDIEAEDAHELFSLIKWAEEEFNIHDGTLLMRFGNPEYTGATIKHLHGHLIVSKREPGIGNKLEKIIGVSA